MTTFTSELSSRAEKDKKMCAVLRRSLAFKLGTYTPAFPYVEHRLKEDSGTSDWNRLTHYLVAGLWALKHVEHSNPSQGVSLPKACKLHYLKRDHSPSAEKRFLSLIEADSEELPNRLRQMVNLIDDVDIDFDKLLQDLKAWNHPDRYIQISWARTFYQE